MQAAAMRETPALASKWRCGACAACSRKANSPRRSTDAQALLKEVPENRDVLVHRCGEPAVSSAHSGGARATLARCEATASGTTAACIRSAATATSRCARPRAAIEAFLRGGEHQRRTAGELESPEGSVPIRPARPSEAENAAAHVERLASLPAEVVTATGMFADGETHARRADDPRISLLNHGNHVEGMRLLAKIGMKLDVLDDAEFLLESALMLAPDYHAVRYDYALTLLQRHKHAQALAELDRLLEIDPDNRAYRITYATACVGLGQSRGGDGALSRAARRDAPGRRICICRSPTP